MPDQYVWTMLIFCQRRLAGAVRAGGPRNREAMILICYYRIGLTVYGTSREFEVVVYGTESTEMDCLSERETR
jgi:hypothetical protein